MNLLRFSVLTVLGAGLWNAFLTVLGYHLRQNWQLVIKYSKTVDEIMIVVILILIGLYIRRYMRRKKNLKKTGAL